MESVQIKQGTLVVAIGCSRGDGRFNDFALVEKVDGKMVEVKTSLGRYDMERTRVIPLVQPLPNEVGLTFEQIFNNHLHEAFCAMADHIHTLQCRIDGHIHG